MQINESLIKKIIFFGEKINNFIIDIIEKTGIPNPIVLLTIIYLVGLFVLIKSLNNFAKPIIGYIIIALIIWLVIGFFRI